VRGGFAVRNVAGRACAPSAGAVKAKTPFSSARVGRVCGRCRANFLPEQVVSPYLVSPYTQARGQVADVDGNGLGPRERATHAGDDMSCAISGRA
jgi:hypothetical protein